MNALELLKNQHRELEAIFSKLEESRDAEETATLFAELADTFMIHGHLEEQIFYPAAFEERTESELREAVEEHLQVKRLIADMLDFDVEDPQWTAKCTVLKEDIQHHVKEEESTLFPMVEKAMSQGRLGDLATEMRKLEAELEKEGAPRELVFEETREPVLPV